mgnify:CR=1 FL=1
MAISLTESAAERVRTFLASRGHGLGLRLGVRKTGCSGFAYVVNYADDSEPDDVVFEDEGVKVSGKCLLRGLHEGAMEGCADGEHDGTLGSGLLTQVGDAMDSRGGT